MLLPTYTYYLIQLLYYYNVCDFLLITPTYVVAAKGWSDWWTDEGNRC